MAPITPLHPCLSAKSVTSVVSSTLFDAAMAIERNERECDDAES